MSKLFKAINNQKIISILLVICMILPIIPTFGVSAAVSGITYYENNFELPLYGATGCPVKDVPGITAGTAFTILEEQGSNLKVKLSNGTETTIAKAYCMINLPDIVPSIKYDITNSYSSVFKIRGTNIAGITGQSLYQNGTSKKNNPRIGKSEYLVPILYETAIKIAAAQKKALSEDYTLVVYEAYRPTFAQDKIYAAYNPLVTTNVRGDYPTSWFIANGKSNHQEGYAIDLSLAKVTSVSFTTLSNPAYKIANLTVTNCTMITPIHDLTVDSAVYNYQDGMVIYDKTAWQSYTKTAVFAGNADCQRLQKYMTDAGLTPFAAEYWHFNDVDARNNLISLNDINGNWELTTNMSIIKADLILTSGGEILIESDDYNNSTSIVTYPRVIHLPDGSSRYPGAIVPSNDVVTSNGYYMGESGEKIFAFCIDPGKDGAAEVAGGSYYVTLSEKLTDKFEIAALKLAAHDDAKTILYSGLSFADMDYWVNYAVKIVVKFYEMTGKNKAKTIEEINNLIPVSPPHGSDFIPSSDNAFGNKVIAAIKAAYNWIVANENATLASGNIEVNCITSNLRELKSETQYGGLYKGEFEVKIDSNLDTKFKVSFEQGTGSYFSEFKLCDASGTPFSDGFAHEFTNGDHFWIVGNLPELAPGQTHKEEHFIKVTAIGEFGEEYWIGKPADNNIQRYVFITYNDESTNETKFKVYDERPDIPKTTSIRIGKINNTTGQPVPGTKFLVEQIDGTYSTTVTVGSDGYYTLDDIPKGTYKITEIYVPKPLIVDPIPKTIYIDPETATEDTPIIVEFVNDQMVCVHIYKYDSKTNELLNGAQFQLSRKDETSALFTGITGESKCNDCGLCKNPCDSDGVICFGALDKGWYTVKEINPPPGYLFDPKTHTVQTFEVTGKEIQEIELKYDNKRRPELEIIKIDNDGNPLDGVVFDIWKSGTTEKFTGTTQGGSILIEWDNDEYPLDEGSYSICEVSVPQGYILSNEIKEVNLVGNTRISVTFTNNKRPGLTIEKQDEQGQPLAGVTFEIWKSGTQETFRGTTDTSGLIVFEWDNDEYPLDEGAYSIREVSVPQGYLKDSTVREINLVKNKMNSINFTNNKRPELEIVKVNSAGEPLAGAVFTIKRAGTTTEYELITDNAGKIIIPFDSVNYPLEADRYVVTEKVPPNGYILSEPNYQEVILEPNTRKTLTFENPEKPKLTIEKYDQRGDGNGGLLPLSPVTFRIWKSDGSYNHNFTTDTNGKIRITDLIPGEYHIKELSTKDGYVLNAETKTIILHGNDDVTVTFYNLKRPELLITKLDAKTNKPLAGAHFQISKGDQVLFDDLITNADGEILIPYNDQFRLLEDGVYKVTETRAPAGYDIVLPSSKNVILKNGERTRVEFNDIRKPTLIITKLNALTKKPIPNTLYNIKWENPATGGVHDLGNWYTNKNGQIIFEFVEVGWYVVTEIMPAPGMTKASNPVTRIYLSPGTNAYSDNELRTSDNSSGENLNTSGLSENTPPTNNGGNTSSGITVIDPFDNTQVIEFPVHQYNSGNSTVSDNQAFTYSDEISVISDVTISGVTTDESDTEINIIFIYDDIDMTETVLSEDEIENREYDGDDEYVNPNYPALQTGDVGDVFTDVSGNDYTFVNNNGIAAFANDYGTIIDFPLNSIIIRKEDATNGNMLAGGVFELYRMSDETSGQSGTLVARLVTGNSGMLAVIGIEAGTYFVKEVKAPENYTLNTQGIQTALFVPDSTSNIEFTFSNYPFGAILVDKTDAQTNKPLPGARFELKRADGSHVAYGTTDNYGHVTFGFLEPGAYIVAEQEAPDGYQIDTSPQTVYVPANGRMQTVYFKNQPFGSLMIIKKDAKLKTPIKDVKFKITDIHGANIGDVTQGNGFAADGIYTTDGNGEIRIDHLPQGYYLITEVYAPDGYLIDESSKVVYAEWGKIKTCEFWNSRTGALVIAKYDAVTKMPLKDAVFMITDSKGAVIGESGGIFRTDDMGHIYIYDLTPGSYRVYEEAAPDGYILDNTVKTIDVLDEKMYYLEFFNEPVNNFTIMKYDSETREPLQGAVIRVQKLGSTTTFIGDFETDVDGMIVIENLLPGSYSVQEIQAPKNYVLDNTVKTISLEQNKPQVVTLYNKPYGSLQIRKFDSITKQPLAGATFKVTAQNGRFIGEYTTDITGFFTIQNLQPDFYIVEEITPPNGYLLDSSPKTIEVPGADIKIVDFYNVPLGTLIIRKVEADTLIPLEGAEFSVKTQNGQIIGSNYRSGADGTITITGLNPGFYTVTETKAPENYTLGDNMQTIEVKSGVINEVTFRNRPFGSLVIKKVDKITGNPLTGAQFTVYQQGGAFIGEYETGGDGTINIPSVEPGYYVITETRAPTGYVLDSTGKTVEVKAVVPTVTTFTNAPLSGIEILKTDAVTHEALTGATFEITKANGEKIGSFKTDSAGKILVTELVEGTYIISETIAPNGYLRDELPKTVAVVSGKLTSVEFTNMPYGSITIKKTDEITGAPLAGAEFTVTKQNGEFIGNFTTASDGTIIIQSVEPGYYIIGETKSPTGYILDKTSKTVEVKPHIPTVIAFTNKPLSGIEILKVDYFSKIALTGASFKVERVNGEVIGEYVTDETGKILVTDLQEGAYIISEIVAPQGYVISEQPKTITVVSGKITSVTFADKPLSGIEIIKVDYFTQNVLSGAVFEITRANGEKIGEYTTDGSGKIIVYDLTDGIYVVSETKAPQGYMIDEIPKNVTVKSGKLETVKFADKPLSGIEILKTDAVTHEALTGATFIIERSNGERIGSFKTDSAGKIIVSDLTEGTYIVSETIAPDGYIRDELPKTVNVTSGKLTTVEFTNQPYGSITIKKTDEITGAPLAGAEFTVTKQNGEFIGNFTTASDGTIIVQSVEPGYYIIGETKCPIGYILDKTSKTVEVKPHIPTVITFTNKPLSGIEILKVDYFSKIALTGASFKVERVNGEVIGEYVTDETGKILVADLQEGAYIISEIVAPQGYVISEQPKTVTVVSGKITSVTFADKPLSGIEIIKVDYFTQNILSGAVFEITRANGEKIGEYTTDGSGKIIVYDLTDGVYIVSEIKAPQGYMIDEIPKNVTVKSGKLETVKFADKPLSGIEILKTDAVTHQALSGATFEIARANGEKIGNFVTDRTGKIVVHGLDEGVYIVSEVFAPDGYVRDELPKTVTVKSGKLESVEFQNKPYSGIEIVKIDYFTNAPLLGATFAVERSNGEKIGEFTTDNTGKVIVSNLTDGVYIVSEIIAPQGYVISEQPKTVEVKSGVLTSVKFADKPLAGIEILKVDKFTHLPLSGATFEITKANGEKIGSFKTDRSGKIIIPDLEDGVYIVSELFAPEGYQIDEVPKTVTVKSGKLTQVEFEDKPLATLKILKLNSITREPIQGVEFTIAKMNGEKLMNEFGSLTFKTDISGAIYVPRLTDGYYVVTEVKTVEGYFLDKEPKTVLVEADKDTVLEVTNIPMSGLLIVKTDEQTGKPLAGAVYDIKRADGQFVTGTIMDANQPGTQNNSPSKSTSENGDITGSYTTDANGRIQINGLAAGEYMVIERKAPDGYEQDTNVYTVTVVPGKMVTLQLTNKPKSGLRLIKIDSITKKGIFGVEFMLLDKNNKVVGVYYTDNAGVIDFTSDITEGRYTIRETRAANGYYLDEIPKTVEFVAGKVTEIVWENTPQLGQIQILKKSADDNEINGLPAGSPLQGAIFEIYNYRTGSLVDRIVSGKDGRAISNPLPLGRYIVKEVQAPKYYILSDKTLDIELEFATQIIKQEFLNYSANTGVSVRKAGNVEAMPNNEIRYDIKELRNTSTVPLTDFYFRDVIPTNAVRLTKIVTGTFNQSVKYKVIATTNKGDTRVIADNLSTTKNNVIDCSSAALGLKADEFITSFSFIFGTVKAGFSLVETPQIYVKVLSNLQNGLEFANKCDVGGKYNGEWIVGNSTWTTKIYNPQKLPKTGY